MVDLSERRVIHGTHRACGRIAGAVLASALLAPAGQEAAAAPITGSSSGSAYYVNGSGSLSAGRAPATAVDAYVAPDKASFLSAVDISTAINSNVDVRVACGVQGSFTPPPCGSATVSVVGNTNLYLNKTAPAQPAQTLSLSATAFTDPVPVASGTNVVKAESGSATIRLASTASASTGPVLDPTFWTSQPGSSVTLAANALVSASTPVRGRPQLMSIAASSNFDAKVSYETGHLKVKWSQSPAALLVPTTSIRALATAVGQDGTNIPISFAAKSMGYDHFNWVSWVVKDADLALCANLLVATPNCRRLSSPYAPDTIPTPSGPIPKQGTIDPPFGGYQYLIDDRQPQDFAPEYWDEYYGGPEWSKKYVASASIDYTPDFWLSEGADPTHTALGYLFKDDVVQHYAGTSEFVTALVGVKSHCSNALSARDCNAGQLGTEDLLPFMYKWSVTNNALDTVKKDGTGSGTGPASPFQPEQLSVGGLLSELGLSLADLAGLGLAVDPSMLADVGPALPSTSIPEGSTLAMLLSGLVLLCLVPGSAGRTARGSSNCSTIGSWPPTSPAGRPSPDGCRRRRSAT